MSDHTIPSVPKAEKAYTCGEGEGAEYAEQGTDTPPGEAERRMSFAEKVVKPKKKENAWLAHVKRGRPLPSRTRLWAMIFGIFGVMFLVGWNDASQGPLLPLLQSYYNVNYTVISIIWIMTAVGVVTAAISNVFLADWLGFGILTPLGALLQTIGYCFMCWGGPYPLFVIAYLFIGCGVGWQDAQVNSMASRMPYTTTVMFLAHAIYGLGATVSPFVSTAFLQKLPETFYHYFAISLGLAFATVVMLVLVFQGRSEEGVVGDRVVHGGPLVMPDAGAGMEGLREHAQADEENAAGGASANGLDGTSLSRVNATPKDDQPEAEQRSSASKFKAIVRSPRTFCLAFYIFAYMGIEVSIGGWATTFLLEERGGDDRSGYVTSGYFGGLTVGRIILIPVTNYLGHRTSVYVYSAICLALEFIIWFVPSLIGSAVSISLVGVFMGPMYPSCVLIITEIMPGDLHTGTIGMLACLGVVGSAIMPFVTGAIANEHGVWVLQPVLVALWIISLVLWMAVSRFKRVDGK